jgi:hypothetical protein
MDKTFALEKAGSPENDYHTQIMSVINALERRIRIVNPDEDKELFKVVHEKKRVDARRESAEYEPIRNDILETFGVSQESGHVYIYDAHRGSIDASVEQRAVRCFVVVYDTINHEGFYGEGRTIHNMLLNKVVDIITEAHPDISEDAIFDGMDTNPPRFVFVKGFMSNDGFKNFPERYRAEQERPLVNAEGEKIATAEGWFISGNNLEEAEGEVGEASIDTIDK